MHAINSAMWQLCVLVLFVAYADAGVKNGFCVCELSGRYHYQTFDDAFIRFDGMCYFQLIDTMTITEPVFSVYVRNEMDGKTFTRTLETYVKDQWLRIQTGNRVTMDDNPVSVPYYKDGINITVEEDTLEVYVARTVTILFDGKQKVTIKVPESYKGTFLGLCGDCNGNTADDFRKIGEEKVLAKNLLVEAQIGTSYTITDETSQCPVNAVNDTCSYNEKCYRMHDESFIACTEVIGMRSTSNLIDSCKVDVCMGIDMCVAFESFANECTRQKVPVQWKALVGCEGPCEKKPCQNNGTCIPTSSNRNYTCNCTKYFVGDNCEIMDPCLSNPCKNYGTCYSKNMNGTFKCSCSNNYTGNTCEIAPKDCVCRAFGSLHYITFDGQLINFMGRCKYTLAVTKASSNLPKFSVEVKNEKRGNTSVFYTRFVDLKINGNTFRMLPGSKLKVNGYLMILPLTNYLKVSAIFWLGWVTIWTDFGLRVDFDGVHRVIVTVPRKYMGQLTGICGDCNKKKDDYKTKFGKDVSSSNNKFSLIGRSYQVVDDSDTEETNCTVADYVENCNDYETDDCKILINRKGVFSMCLQKVSNTTANIYYEACKTDVCAYQNFSKILMKVKCQAFEAFAKECEKNGIFTNWRDETFCQKKCDYNQFYTLKSTLCQPNCLPLPICTVESGEGCVCNSGHQLMGDTCVKLDSCGCVYNGMGIKRLSKVLTPDCSKTVQCIETNLFNTSQGCATNEECLSQYGKRVCQCSPPFKKENSKCLVPALPEQEMASALDKFVRVSMANIKGTPLQKISTNRPGVCAVICRNNTKCKSFNFDEMNDECKLFSVNAVDQTLVTVNCPYQDYYQLIASMEIVIRGGTIYPCGPLTEYAVVKSLEDCRAKCNKNNCKSMDYSVVNQECSVSNSTGKDFEIIGDSEFVFYGQLPVNDPRLPYPYDG